MVISGAGAGLNELIALAATGEMVPTAKRGIYVGAVVMTIIPFAPSVLWAELIQNAASWRWVGAFVGGWNLMGFVLLAAFYNPPPRPNTQGNSKREILKRVDYIGGFLSIAGITTFMMGLQWGAQQVCHLVLFKGAADVVIVLVEVCTRLGAPLRRYRSHHCLLFLGSLGSQIPHGASEDLQPGQENDDYHPSHHLHLWRQLFQHASLLAHGDLQCLWQQLY